LNEIEIELTDVNTRDFFGDQDVNIEKLKSCFPKLKIVARGTKLKAYGEKALLEDFNKSVHRLLNYFIEHNFLDQSSIERIIIVKKNIKDKDFEIKSSFILNGINGKVIKAKTLNQLKIIELTKDNDLVFIIGPAGTGKTFTSIALAVKALKEKQVKRIILTRPAVEAGENLGFLPGDMKEKLDPYMQPLYDGLREMIPSERLNSYLDTGIIQIAPLAFMRGRTLDDAFVILDEAQNTTHAQMKMFLTRMGKNAKFIITGDPGQIDLPRRVMSGLKEAILILKETIGIGILYLDDKDVIRHYLVKKVIEAYRSVEHQN